MSTRRMLAVSLFLLVMTMAGCAGFSLFGERSPEEEKKARLSKDDLWNQTQALEREKAAYQKRLAEQQEELARVTRDLSDQQAEIAQANKQVTALNRSVEDLNMQMRLLQEAQQQRPLQEVELAPPKKEKQKPLKRTPPPKRTVRKPPPKTEEQGQDQKPADMSAMMKQLTDAKQKLAAGKSDTGAAPRKKEPEKPEAKAAEAKPEEKPEAKAETATAKARDVRSMDDLALRMKLFEEGEQGKSGATDLPPAPVKKETVKEEKPVAAARQQTARTERAAPKPRLQSLKVKILAGDGNIASAKALSAKLGKMGYRVKSVDKAPRSDFDATVVFYGSEHRAAGEAMAKRLGGGTAARPLTWSSSFDIIVVSGRKN
ncbi:MAG: LytR C-terminal domain-containing protein [Syntrophales bacterium]